MEMIEERLRLTASRERLENSLGWTLGRVLGCEAQGSCLDIGSGTAWVQGADLESTLSLSKTRRERFLLQSGIRAGSYLGVH